MQMDQQQIDDQNFRLWVFSMAISSSCIFVASAGSVHTIVKGLLFSHDHVLHKGVLDKIPDAEVIGKAVQFRSQVSRDTELSEQPKNKLEERFRRYVIPLALSLVSFVCSIIGGIKTGVDWSGDKTTGTVWFFGFSVLMVGVGPLYIGACVLERYLARYLYSGWRKQQQVEEQAKELAERAAKARHAAAGSSKRLQRLSFRPMRRSPDGRWDPWGVYTMQAQASSSANTAKQELQHQLQNQRLHQQEQILQAWYKYRDAIMAQVQRCGLAIAGLKLLLSACAGYLWFRTHDGETHDVTGKIEGDRRWGLLPSRESALIFMAISIAVSLCMALIGFLMLLILKQLFPTITSSPSSEEAAATDDAEKPTGTDDAKEEEAEEDVEGGQATTDSNRDQTWFTINLAVGVTNKAFDAVGAVAKGAKNVAKGAGNTAVSAGGFVNDAMTSLAEKGKEKRKGKAPVQTPDPVQTPEPVEETPKLEIMISRLQDSENIWLSHAAIYITLIFTAASALQGLSTLEAFTGKLECTHQAMEASVFLFFGCTFLTVTALYLQIYVFSSPVVVKKALPAARKSLAGYRMGCCRMWRTDAEPAATGERSEAIIKAEPAMPEESDENAC